MKKKNLLLTFLIASTFLLGGGAELMAQTTVTIGDGTSTTTLTPLKGDSKYSVSETIYTASDLNAALTSAGYSTPAVGCIFETIAYKSTTAATRNIEIYITTTTKSQFNGSSDVVPVSSLDKVFSGSVSFVANDWTTITLNTQYEWDGVSNLLILVNDKTGTNASSTISFYYTDVSSRTIYISKNNNSFNPTGLPTGTRISYRSNIQLTIGMNDKPRPKALSTSAIGTTTATLGWTATSDDVINYTYQYKLASNDWESTAGEGTVTSTTTNLFSLTAGTIYDFRVKANYSGGSSNWIEKNFITASDVTDNNQFTYGFEDMTKFEFWTISLATYNSDIVNTNSHNGSNCFYFKNNMNSQVIISPLLHTSSNGVHVKLYWKGSGTYSTILKIGYSTTTNTESFTYPQHVTTNQNTYQCSEFDLAYSDIKYIAIQFDRNGSQNGDVYIDDIELSECQVSCSVPESFTLSSLSSNSATFTWNAVDGDINGYEVYVSENSTIPTEETSGNFTATNSYTQSSLEENTQYYAWVRTKCEEDSYSSWSSTVDFTTDCGVKALPYTNGFEDASDLDCWTMNNCYSSTKITSGSAHTGTYKFIFSYSTSHDLQTIITPELNTTANGLRVDFFFRTSSSSGTPKLKIAYSTTTNEFGSFDWINCIEATVNSSYYYTYQYFGIDLPYSDIKYIAIQYDSNGSTTNIFLDDIKFSDIPTVNLPYEYGFETDAELNNWIKRDCYSNTGIKSGGHNGSQSFGFIRGTTMETQCLITPMLNGTTYGALIGFYFTANINCKFQIGYSTTNDDTRNFTFGKEVTETTASYKYYEYYCPANTKFICIKYVATNTSYYTLSIDDIRIIAINKVSNGSEGYAYWDNSLDWNPVGVPSAEHNVYIQDNMTIRNGCSASANSIAFGTSGSLTIADGGQLICNNAVEATVEKEISKWPTTKPADGWYFIASPISSDLAPTAVTNMITDNIPNDDESTPRTYDLYGYDATASKPWVNYRGHSNDFVIANGRGYLYASKEGTALNFSGNIQPSNENVTVESLNVGYNLVGNPYTCNAYINQNYYMLVDGSTVSATVTDKATPIAPCTGVVVESVANGSVTFSKDYPVASANNGNLQMVLAQNVATRGERTAQTLDKAIVSFNEGSQLGKFYFGTQDANLYIPQNNEEYAIMSSSAQGEMPVNFRAYVAGEYTITVNPEEVEMGYLHLIDNIAGKDVDLLANPRYSFNARTDDYESRFRLVFSTTMVNAEMGEDFAFMSDGQFVIANEGEATLQVIDVTGRVVATESVNGTCSKAINAKAGVYVLRLINGTDVKTQKVVIK